MDVPSFALNETQRIFQRAGLSILFPDEAPQLERSSLPSPYWEAVLKRLPSDPLAVITYEQLGEDFTPEPDPARSSLFRSLLTELAMPKGTFAFLPYSFPDSPGNPADFSRFLDTLSSFNSRYLLIFGSMPSVDQNLSPQLQHLFKVPGLLQLPSLENINSGTPETMNQFVSKLRNCLRHLSSNDS